RRGGLPPRHAEPAALSRSLGHSHRAVRPVSFAPVAPMDPASLYGSPEAHARAWRDAAEFVDDKWEHAFAQAELVRQGFARLLGDAGGGIALAPNTHELVVRLLSALPLRERPRLVTTDGEFHTIRRQLDRLAEEGLDVVRIAEAPVESLAERLGQAVNDRTALVLVSLVFFDTGLIATGLGEVASRCRRHGSRLLVDAYHALNVVPVSLTELGLA